MFKRFVAVAIAGMFAAGMAYAQAPAPGSAGHAASAAPGAGMSTCEAKAVDKHGKQLNGAAKASFLRKCEAGMKGSAAKDCEGKAVGSNGKPLFGAAKTSFMKKCQVSAGQ